LSGGEAGSLLCHEFDLLFSVHQMPRAISNTVQRIPRIIA